MLVVAWVAAMSGCGGKDKASGAASNGSATPGSVASELKSADNTTAVDAATPGAPDMKKVSYIIGMGIGKDISRTLKQVDVVIDADELAAGLKGELSGAKARFTEEEIQKIMMEFQTVMIAKQKEKASKVAEENAKLAVENKAKGDEFLAANAKKEGVKTTASGLQYRIIKSGAGKAPKAGDTVTVHYKGQLIDGKVFDSSYERGEPVEFQVGEVIPGWDEALLLMHEGDVWEVAIPSALAYGERAAGPIPPSSVLVFELELQKVGAPAETQAPKPPAPGTDLPTEPVEPK